MFKQDPIHTYYEEYPSAYLKDFYLGCIERFLINYLQVGVQFLREVFPENTYNKNVII